MRFLVVLKTYSKVWFFQFGGIRLNSSSEFDFYCFKSNGVDDDDDGINCNSTISFQASYASHFYLKINGNVNKPSLAHYIGGNVIKPF